VGITGGIGSGKSAVTKRLAARGIPIIDADLAARVVVEPGTPGLAAIVAHFGPGVLTPEGRLDRARLRALVFNAPQQRRVLENITHPLIGEEIRRQFKAALGGGRGQAPTAAGEAAGGQAPTAAGEGQAPPYAVLSSPLLLESSQHELVDCVVVVDVPESVQLERTMRRDSNTAALVRKIMAAQLSRKQRLARADRVVDNSGTLQALEAQVEALHGWLLGRIAESG
jgi:dephospho-CoA kinase